MNLCNTLLCLWASFGPKFKLYNKNFHVLNVNNLTTILSYLFEITICRPDTLSKHLLTNSFLIFRMLWTAARTNQRSVLRQQQRHRPLPVLQLRNRVQPVSASASVIVAPFRRHRRRKSNRRLRLTAMSKRKRQLTVNSSKFNASFRTTARQRPSSRQILTSEILEKTFCRSWAGGRLEKTTGWAKTDVQFRRSRVEQSDPIGLTRQSPSSNPSTSFKQICRRQKIRQLRRLLQLSVIRNSRALKDEPQKNEQRRRFCLASLAIMEASTLAVE